MTDQVPTRGTTTQAIMRSPAFVAGVDDKRNGLAPNCDLYCFSQDENDIEAKSKINGHWNYERGASLAPTAMPLKVNGVLNPEGSRPVQRCGQAGVYRAMKTKQKRGLPTIVDEIRETFRSDNNNIIRRGELLIEARAMVQHGEWLSWLERYFEIEEALSPEPEESEDEELDEASAEEEDESEAEKEAEAILDGPPPDLPPTVEPPEPTDFTLAQFDKAIQTLAELHTKSVSKFVSTDHSADDLKKIADFLCAVATALNGKTLRRIGTGSWTVIEEGASA